MTIQTVAVIGAGQMGNGIAHVAALSGYDVILQDIGQPQLDRALRTIDGNLARQVKKGQVSADDAAAALARIRATPELAAVGDAQLVIEAAALWAGLGGLRRLAPLQQPLQPPLHLRQGVGLDHQDRHAGLLGPPPQLRLLPQLLAQGQHHIGVLHRLHALHG